MTGTSSNVRARTATITNYNNVSCEMLTLDSEGTILVDDDVPRINLTPTGSLQVRYGFNLSGQYEKPRFLVKDSESKANFLSIRIALDKDQLDFMNCFDYECRKHYVAEHPDIEWQPIVTYMERDNLHLIKVKVYFAGTVTLMRVWDKEGPEIVCGWEHAKQLIEDNDCFYRADAKLVIKPQKVWNINGKAGISFVATQLGLRPAVVPPVIDVFAEAEW